MTSIFINFSNHPSAQWGTAQREAALRYGPIQELPFPAISAAATGPGIDKLADEYLKKVMAFSNPVVLIQGEMVFTYRFVRLLEQHRIPALAAVSRRRVRETQLPDGSTQKTAFFTFDGFRRYWE